MNEFIQLSFHAEYLEVEKITELIERYEPYSIAFESACEQEIFDIATAHADTPQWQQQKITATFDGDFSVQQLIDSIREISPTSKVKLEKLADRDWQACWQNSLQPIEVSDSLVICPDSCSVDTAATVVYLNPGMAFGSGSHETTRLCLQHLEKIDNWKSKSLFDVGCGSGILAITAARLGAASVTGIDIDQRAVSVAQENAVQNQVADRVDIYRNDEFVLHHSEMKFDVVVANILSQTLIELAPFIIQSLATSGEIMLSGILKSQVNDVKNAYGSKINFNVIYDNYWALLHGKYLI